MKELLRLAGWGTAAVVALMLAVATAYSPGGQQRLFASNSGKGNVQNAPLDSPAPAGPVVQPAPVQDARLDATEAETRRLSDVIRELSADREQLLTRIASLERNLEDVTGSIKRQAALAAAPVAAPSSPPPRRPAIDPPATTAVPPAAAPVQDAAPAAAAPAPAEPRVAAVEPAAAVDEPADPQPALGADLGGAANFDGLRGLWNSTRKTHAVLIEGLHPVVVVRENTRTRAAELRLIVGPMPDLESAAQFCATLTAAKRHCQPASFEGQELSLTSPEPPRRTVTAPERRAPPRPSVRPNP